jgi:hypothetical protein
VDAKTTSPALEYLSPVKGPSLEQITTAVATGQTQPSQAASQYDSDVTKQAKQLDCPDGDQRRTEPAPDGRDPWQRGTRPGRPSRHSEQRHKPIASPYSNLFNVPGGIGRLGFLGSRAVYGDELAAIVELELEFADGHIHLPAQTRTGPPGHRRRSRTISTTDRPSMPAGETPHGTAPVRGRPVGSECIPSISISRG